MVVLGAIFLRYVETCLIFVFPIFLKRMTVCLVKDGSKEYAVSDLFND